MIVYLYTGDCTEGVTVTVIGSLDVPLVILTATSINPDDSESLNCPDANSTVDPAHYISFIKPGARLVS